MHSKLIIPILIAIVLWRIYLRTRRSFGRQRVKPRRMAVRVGLLGLFAIALLLMAGEAPWSLALLLAGAACGALLALLALRHTQIVVTAEGRFYTPHTYIGLTVTVLFLARLLYDFSLLRHNLALSGAASGAPAFTQSPLTLAASGTFIAYYIAYSLGVLRRSRLPSAAPARPAEPR